jgi:hypothetical protein
MEGFERIIDGCGDSDGIAAIEAGGDAGSRCSTVGVLAFVYWDSGVF